MVKSQLNIGSFWKLFGDIAFEESSCFLYAARFGVGSG